jgi:NAD(P)-dependent dehydrogenase (short-subunit alcohol dehydrogenase family)
MKKVVLVTGASSGIGLAIASFLSKKGYSVYGGSRTAPPSDLFQTVKLDVTDEANIDNVVKDIIAKEGRIDVLINNAGVGSAGAFERTPLADVKKSFDVNVFGVLRITQAVLPYMRKHHYGRIINMSTLGSSIGLPFRAFYSSSKGAMVLMTEALRLEVDRFGIQACTIHPGEVRTDIAAHRIVSIPAEDEIYGKTIKKAFDSLNASVDHGKDPEIFGPLVEKIIVSKRVKRNYFVGTFNEKLGVKLKHILPYYLYEKILKSYFNSDN